MPYNSEKRPLMAHDFTPEMCKALGLPETWIGFTINVRLDREATITVHQPMHGVTMDDMNELIKEHSLRPDADTPLEQAYLLCNPIEMSIDIYGKVTAMVEKLIGKYRALQGYCVFLRVELKEQRDLLRQKDHAIAAYKERLEAMDLIRQQQLEKIAAFEAADKDWMAKNG